MASLPEDAATAPDAVWLSTQEAARRLGVTARTLYRFIDQGDLAAYRLGRVIRLKLTDVDAFIESHAERFPALVEVLCEALSEPAEEVWEPFMIHKAVLIGGDALFHHFEKAANRLSESIRCRYVLVR